MRIGRHHNDSDYNERCPDEIFGSDTFSEEKGGPYQIPNHDDAFVRISGHKLEPSENLLPQQRVDAERQQLEDREQEEGRG
jgi:hypothetical protein